MQQPRLQPSFRQRRTRFQRGLTLVECAVVTCMAAILLGAGLPSFQRALERRHLEGAAAQLRTDLQVARSLAVASGDSVRLSVGSACYVVHTGPAGSCSCDAAGNATCTGGVPMRSVALAGGTALSASAGSITYDGRWGTVSPTTTLRVTAAHGDEVRHVVAVTGRVRTCSTGVAGYARC